MSGLVALFAEGVGDGDFAGRESPFGVREEDASRTAHAAADGIAAGQEGGPAGGADLRRDVEIGKAKPLGGHAIEMGCPDRRGAVAAEIAVAEVIGEDDDDVGPLGGLSGGDEESAEGQDEEQGTHGGFPVMVG